MQGTDCTCYGDLGRPLRRPVQHALLDALHLLAMDGLTDYEDVADQVEDLRLVPLADLHAVLHSHYDVLGAIFGPVLGALLRSACSAHTQVYT